VSSRDAGIALAILILAFWLTMLTIHVARIQT
jgi:hypothetical protein